jgi:hypothetical protein
MNITDEICRQSTNPVDLEFNVVVVVVVVIAPSPARSNNKLIVCVSSPFDLLVGTTATTRRV